MKNKIRGVSKNSFLDRIDEVKKLSKFDKWNDINEIISHFLENGVPFPYLYPTNSENGIILEWDADDYYISLEFEGCTHLDISNSKLDKSINISIKDAKNAKDVLIGNLKNLGLL